MKKKKWLKRKGCKNCALVWVEKPCCAECNEDCDGHGEWVVQPYYHGKEMIFVSKIFIIDNLFNEKLIMKNCFFDENGNLNKIKNVK